MVVWICLGVLDDFSVVCEIYINHNRKETVEHPDA